MNRLLCALLLLSPTFAGCDADVSEDPDTQCDGAKCDGLDGDEAGANSDGEEPRTCVALRGNGELIFAHFSSLARIAEHYGPIWGSAGGSSASITQFLLESVQINPVVTDCGGKPCSRVEQGERIALLLKSLTGYAQELGNTPEAASIGSLTGVMNKIKASPIQALSFSNIRAAYDALKTLTESEELRDLVNDELLATIDASPDFTWHVRDIIKGVTSLGAFSVGCTEEELAMGCNSKTMFVRPGLLDFAALAQKVGRVGDFYAGLGPQDVARMHAWVDGCAPAAKGHTWAEIAAMPLGSTTCGAEFAAMLRAYRAVVVADRSTEPERLSHPIGAHLAALVSTSVLTGRAKNAYLDARQLYNAALPVSFDVDFKDVRFGYWGAADDLAQVGQNTHKFDDLKTAKFLPLGPAPWREVLSFSPAEPGLSRVLALPSSGAVTQVSAGGWSDLHPTLVLENLGCDQVVYVTRRGEESTFAIDVAREFGMDDAGVDALYNLAADSSYSRSIAAADAVWCTDWNNDDATDFSSTFNDGYNAPMKTDDPFFTEGADPYDNVVQSLSFPGC